MIALSEDAVKPECRFAMKPRAVQMAVYTYSGQEHIVCLEERHEIAFVVESEYESRPPVFRLGRAVAPCTGFEGSLIRASVAVARAQGTLTRLQQIQIPDSPRATAMRRILAADWGYQPQSLAMRPLVLLDISPAWFCIAVQGTPWRGFALVPSASGNVPWRTVGSGVIVSRDGETTVLTHDQANSLRELAGRPNERR